MDHRYRKRMQAYWARVEAREHRKIDRLDIMSWFDYWHTHIDWRGRCKAHPENIQAVISTGIRLLQHLELRAKNRPEPIQLWATICSNTMDNAVYAHSKNPNGNDYPHDFQGVIWDYPVPNWIMALLSTSHQVGMLNYDDEIIYIIRRRE